MHLVYFTRGNFHTIDPIVSWAILVGAGYGLVRLLWDVLRLFGVARRVEDAAARERWKVEQRRQTGGPSATPPAPPAPPPSPPHN